MRSLGIDVGVRKGLDAVVLDDRRVPLQAQRGMQVNELPALIKETAPHVIAIDSPPAWARSGGSRETERQIRAAGILCFGTPTEDRGMRNRFYDWMVVGFRAFGIAEACGYSRYRTGSADGTAIEVFPHASAVTLAGRLGPTRRARLHWRRDVLTNEGVDADRLVGPDQVDAALAALTGLFALDGSFYAPGDPEEGVIVVPVRALVSPRYVREVS
ncbi:MAG TPA: DUF429 domain-containing protein [Actinomycetota bacterium]|nr:DUF429 domain-containing protein [Actinomycetota bacterium]